MLEWSDYNKLIEEEVNNIMNLVHESREEVTHYFLNQYETYKSENPRFLININDALDLYEWGTTDYRTLNLFNKGFYYFFVEISFNSKTAEEVIEEASHDNFLKIKWKSSTAMLGHLIDELVRNGYIDMPYSSNTKTAAHLLKIFDLNTTEGSLAIELSETSNHLSTENKGKIKLKPNPDLKP